jgi:branched-chain amino acid transport system ATP-binding protein
VIEARDLRVHYHRGPLALDGVSVMVHPGEVVAVVGPNGSGKSTLLRVLAGLVPPQAGAVHLDGQALTGLPPHQRAARGLILVPERGRILAGLSVRDNLAIGAWRRRDRRAVADDLERVFALFPALKEREHRLAQSLSGGERQMLVLGRALMSAPRVLLLDEPLIGLDSQARQRGVSMIRMFRDSEVAVLLTEHDLAGVREIAARAYGLRGGRVVFSGSADGPGLAGAFAGIYD